MLSTKGLHWNSTPWTSQNRWRALSYPSDVCRLKSSPVSSNTLQVLWIDQTELTSAIHLYVSHPDLFIALTSLVIPAFYPDSTWRSVLLGPSQSLKHFDMSINAQTPREELPPLQYPSVSLSFLLTLECNFTVIKSSTEAHFCWCKRHTLLLSFPPTLAIEPIFPAQLLPLSSSKLDEL